MRFMSESTMLTAVKLRLGMGLRGGGVAANKKEKRRQQAKANKRWTKRKQPA